MFGKKFLKKWISPSGSGLKREIIINAESLETRVAVLENGRLEEFQVEHPTQERLVGSIFKGRIQNLENDLQAAFVDIGLKKNAFLHYWDMTPDADAPRRRRRAAAAAASASRTRTSRSAIPGRVITVQVSKGDMAPRGPV